jgi:hypothetical protein
MRPIRIAADALGVDDATCWHIELETHNVVRTMVLLSRAMAMPAIVLGLSKGRARPIRIAALQVSPIIAALLSIRSSVKAFMRSTRIAGGPRAAPCCPANFGATSSRRRQRPTPLRLVPRAA